MRAVVALSVLLAGLAACSTVGALKVERCHGPRRPANPHGSVLAPPATGAEPAELAAAPARGCGAPQP